MKKKGAGRAKSRARELKGAQGTHAFGIKALCRRFKKAIVDAQIFFSHGVKIKHSSAEFEEPTGRRIVPVPGM